MKREEIADPATETGDTLRAVHTPQSAPATSTPSATASSSGAPSWGRGHAVTRFPSSRLSDAELVAAITQGENEALGVIWDRYAGSVRAVLRSSLGYDADVEDLLQEVFIAFLQGASRLRSADSLRGYLVGVAIRLVMGELRRRRVRRWVTLQPAEELAQAAAPISYDEDAKAAVHALYRLLDAMPSRRRLAFVLRHIEGMEVTEAARVLSVSESTIKREARKARKAIELRAERSEPRLWQYMQTLDTDTDTDTDTDAGDLDD